MNNRGVRTKSGRRLRQGTISLAGSGSVHGDGWRSIGVALMMVSMWSTSACQKPIPTAQPEVRANADSVEIQGGSGSWRYVELATASVGAPLAPPAVPGRVSVDESRSTSVVAPLQGRVDSVVVRLGQRVQQGDRLLSVRSAGLVDLYREIDLMRSKESARSKVVQRIGDLVRLKAAAEKDLIAAEQDLHQAQLAREAAESKLRSLSVNAASEGLYWIVAPRAGVVVDRDVVVGQEAGPDRGEALMQIAELDEVLVMADVPENDVAGLQAGSQAHVISTAMPDHPYQGLVEYIGEVVDPMRRMVDVRVRVVNPTGDLRPNAFVQVEFSPATQPRVVVDASAVVTDDQQSFVFVQQADRPQHLERRPVSVGRQREGKVEIVDGLKAGEVYASKGAILLLNAIDLAQQ